jgi:hypothetical protein
MKSNHLFFLCGCTLIFCVGIFTEAVAQEKVIEKSGKKPDWVNGLVAGYIIETGKGATLDEAKNQAFIRVKDNIVNSVAVKVSSQTEINTRENRTDDQYSLTGSYVEQIKTKTANLPAIRGISENKVSEFYWEKIKNKKTGVVACYYYVKYPFSEAELTQIIFEYQDAQQQIREQLEASVATIDELTNIEEIIERLNILRNLSKQLEDENKALAASNIGKLEDLLKSVQVQETASSEGLLKYFLVYGSRRLTTSQSPKAKSNCATNFKQTIVGDTMVIHYDNKDCRSPVTNTISIDYRFDSKPVKAEFQLPSAYSISKMKLAQGAQFVIIRADENSIGQYKLVIPILLESADPICLKNVTITFSKNRPMITFNLPCDQTLHKGPNTVELSGEYPLNKADFTFESYEIVLISGSITYTNQKTKATTAYKFYNEKIAVVSE